ncbi:nucleolar pre-ribosomal-associated protein 1-like [Watersipora subatra]|uniref:nucleolar pre-ribosomal-associated protein 1-like n=1 Tax=Watersipora subatra TaxID=2589382 RepID=UPI00355B43A5
MAEHSVAASRLLFSGISFAKEEVSALYNESGAVKIRQPFIKFLLALVDNSSPPVLKAIIDEKGLLNGMLSQLHTGSVELIRQVLSTFHTKILASRLVTKTQRIRLFNETTIPQILQCYECRKQSKRELSQDKTQPQAEAQLQKQVCDFVKTLLADQKNGITFADPEYGQGDKNLNHVLNLVLCKSILKSAYMDIQLEEVVIASLTTRPDQLHRYMAMLNESALLVKNTGSWLNAANHVVKIMYTLPAFGQLNLSSSMKEGMLCRIAVGLTSPPAATMKIFKHVLNMSDMSWQYTSLGLFLVVMRRAKEAISAVKSLYSAENFASWQSLFVELFMQLVPPVDVLLHCWSAINKITENQEHMLLTPKFAQRVLDLLILHLELSSGLHQPSSMPINVSAILLDIEKLAARDTHSTDPTEFASLTVKALQLLGELGEEAGLAVMKMEKGKKSTLSRILDLIYGGADPEIALQSKELLIKLLKQSGWFEKLDRELEVWFHYGDKLGSSLNFLERLLQTLFSNPYPYLDQVYSALSTVGDHTRQGRTTSDKLLPFSPLVPIALKLFNEAEQENAAIQSYKLSCFAEVLLQQDDPLPLGHLLSQHPIGSLLQVSQTLLGVKNVSCKGFALPPYSDLSDLFFVSTPASNPELLESILVWVSALTEKRSQLIVVDYCLLALWHHQDDKKEQETVLAAEKLLCSLSDKHSVCSKLVQSGLTRRWYLAEEEEATTLYVSSLFNTMLSSIDLSIYTGHTKTCLEVLKERLLDRLDGLSGVSEATACLILDSVSLFASTYSSSHLVSILQTLLLNARVCSLEKFWKCVEDCCKALFCNRPCNHTDINYRLEVLDSILALDCTEKYKIVYKSIHSSLMPEVIPFSVWKACLDSANSQPEGSQLLLWLIRETRSLVPVQMLLDSFDVAEFDSKLPVLRALFDRLGSNAAGERFGKVFKVLSQTVRHCIKTEGLASCQDEVVILKHILPSAKEKHLMKLFENLNGRGIIGETEYSDDCFRLLMAICHIYPRLYCDFFNFVIAEVSHLTQQAVKCISLELSSISWSEETKTSIQEGTSNNWKQFIFQALRKNFECADWLRLVRVLGSLKYNEDGSNTDLPSSDLFILLTNHSKFVPLIMSGNDSSALSVAKGELLSLMLMLVKMSPSVCHADQYPLLLGGYRATLASNDRKLLHLMYLYEKSGVSTISYSYYSVKESLSSTLIAQPSVEAVLECLDPELLCKSAYNLPLSRPLSHQLTSTDSDSSGADETLYDPAFLLPLFAYIMRPDNTLNIRLLIETGVITYVLCSLSSHAEEVRAAARFILYEFRQHMESSVFSETIQGLYTLDLIKESISERNARVAPVITVFIARTLQLTPEEHMYRVCHNYLLIKPKMEMKLVPEFFRLFYSSSQMFTVERSWILNLLVAGLREDSDCRLYEKLNIFKIILAYGQSSMCSQSDRTEILRIVEIAAALPSSHQMLVKYNIIGWFSNVVFSFPEETFKVLSALKVLVNNCSNDKVWCGMFAGQLVTTLISLLRNQRTNKMRSDMLVEVLYKALLLKSDAVCEKEGSSENPAFLSQTDVDTVMEYLPKPSAPSEHLDSLVKFFHHRRAS